MHGKGTFSWPNGRKYTGNVLNKNKLLQYHLDLKDGYGEFVFENGSSYRGLWKSGK